MAETKSKDRSPSFPFIPLEEAVKRLQAFEQTFGRHPAPAGKAGLAWGMKENSSQAFQTLAALKAFGLLQYEGSAKARTALLTDDARTYLRAQQDSIKKGVLQRLATKPAQIQKFWSIWGADRPPDAVCLDELVLNHAFTDSAANTFLKVYDDTIAHAGLSNSDTVVNDDQDTDALEFQIGDAVNWESGGQVQWKQPRKIVSIDEKDGERFYQVEDAAGQKGWIPVEQAIHHPLAARSAGAFTPPPADLIERADNGHGTTVKEGSRKAVFPVEDGDVTLIFPENISSDGLEELGQYLNIFLKKEQKKKEAE